VGAVVTAVLFTLGRGAIALYLGLAGVATAYGAAGSLVAFVVWVYWSAQIVLLGAELTQVYARIGPDGRIRPRPPPSATPPRPPRGG
jgi:membrane protein